ncbi:MAG: hypothetical protein ACLFTW_07825 [Chitinispirillaceae bacterium]
MRINLPQKMLFVAVIYVVIHSVPLFAGSYEGKIDKYPVWISIDETAPDGKVEGTYFYKKIGTDISLEGTKSGDTYQFTEYDPNGKATGKITCTIRGKVLSGTWTEISCKRKLEIRASMGDSAQMKDVRREAQLDRHDVEMLEKEFVKGECTELSLSYDYKSRHIRSLRMNSTYTCGPYPSTEITRKVYNAVTRESIDFWDEVNPEKLQEAKSYLQKETQRKFTEWRTALPDSEWVQIFRRYEYKVSEEELESDPTAALDKIFTAGNAFEIMTGFYVTPEGAHLSCCGLVGFPHVIKAMDFCDSVVFGPEVVKKFVKDNSVLLGILDIVRE